MATTAKRKKSTANPWPERLRAFRREHGLSQTAAAAKVGVTLRSWTYWETQGIKPSPTNSRLLEQFLRHPEEFP